MFTAHLAVENFKKTLPPPMMITATFDYIFIRTLDHHHTVSYQSTHWDLTPPPPPHKKTKNKTKQTKTKKKTHWDLDQVTWEITLMTETGRLYQMFVYKMSLLTWAAGSVVVKEE